MYGIQDPLTYIEYSIKLRNEYYLVSTNCLFYNSTCYDSHPIFTFFSHKLYYCEKYFLNFVYMTFLVFIA